MYINWPRRTNFSCPGDLSAPILSKALCRIAGFLRGVNPSARLEKYDDWRELDGYHPYRGTIDVDDLCDLVGSPQSLLESMPGERHVFVGVGPQDHKWYLRFYLAWDDEAFGLTGRFDITLPPMLADLFKSEVAPQLGLRLDEQESETYYRSIIPARCS